MLSQAMFGSEANSVRVRETIVQHILTNYEDYCGFIIRGHYRPAENQVDRLTDDGNGVMSPQEYAAHMFQPYSYGTFVELSVAAKVFKKRINVFEMRGQSLELYSSLGEPHWPVVIALFSGNRTNGHFDLLRPIDIHSSPLPQIDFLANRENEFPPLPPVAGQLASSASSVTSVHSQKTEVNKECVKRYREKNPEVNREAVRRYNEKNKLKTWKTKELSGFKYDCNTDYASDKVVTIGERIECQWCHAKKWKEESSGLCCSGGKVQLPDIELLPEPLHSLLINHHPDSEHFLANIRKYNGCFQMTSFGAKEVHEGNFMPTFKVQGQVYHRIGSLLPVSDKDPSFLQIYFVGNEEREMSLRCQHYPGVKPGLISQLQKMLHDNNPYIKDFKTAMENVSEGEEFKVVIHAERKPAGEHRGRFNAPTATEVALVIVGQEFEKRDIILHGRDTGLKRISEIHRSYDSLQYPLIFCRGEDGYFINIPQRDPSSKGPLNKMVSASNFYSYRIMERASQFNYLLLCRSLLNQFLVDMYAKIETERLNFIRHNQSKLRTESYVHLRDAMSRTDGQEVSDLGKIVVLPSSFTGGPRYMHERTQDAMTYVRKYGRPDLFITFTCNPKWTEVQNDLKPGQKAQDRNDIVARIFHIKIKKIMHLLTKGQIFGPSRCYMYTVEWQKRGLPHVHILLWLQNRITPSQIDNVISAEIPDPQADPVLHDIVKSTMIHGPCGVLNRNSPCMTGGSCSKRYPRPLSKFTQTADDGYPQYRRLSPSEGGHIVNIKGIEIDNRWVVPYNPVLSRTFSAHINVELCNSVQSIKYICKYVNKGSDQAVFGLENDFDEVSRYEAGRYISSSEAVWKILGFPIHERFPPVMHLSVHLENGQRVYFTAHNISDKLQNPPKTTLLAFFDLCKADTFARGLLYSEVPSYYVWRNNKFSRRKVGKPVPEHPGLKQDQVIGRIYTVHPNNTECYYLRLLLHEVRGPSCFEDLKTVCGVVHPTFQSACRALGLLEDDAHWDRTLEEASISDSAHKMRQLFAVMLVFCQLANPLTLWEKYRDSLSEDVKKQVETECRGVNIEHYITIVYNKSLLLIEQIVLSMSNQSLQQFGLPSPSRDVNVNREYMRELSYDVDQLSELVLQNKLKLNAEQSKVYYEVIRSIDSKSGQLFFLDAPGGTGKTFLINLLLASVRKDKKIAISVASSGIAATLLDGGKTAHSAFKLPLNLNHSETPLCNISKQSDTAKVLQKCQLIVWDECTMAHKGGIEALDRTLQDIRNDRRLMGGMTVLLAGDFRQTLPVVPRGTRADEVKACIKSSHLWPQVHVQSLRVNMRVHLNGDLEAEEFSKLLLQIGDGKLNEENDGKVHISENLCTVVKDLHQLNEKIYPDLATFGSKGLAWLKERAILTPKNDTAADINNSLLNQLSGEIVKYQSVDVS
ncbi:uncharacterized protein LOC103519163 [Diaphorina citri]|uniref:ATP-dependent DNA helicase n=1 Tax=Diaphorina citri TaxID=121845 RepID=A0A1S3DI71_DIACI|nr:uncharacterized protein LOC103519163 [Diaphorina citri]